MVKAKYDNELTNSSTSCFVRRTLGRLRLGMRERTCSDHLWNKEVSQDFLMSRKAGIGGDVYLVDDSRKAAQATNRQASRLQHL